MRPKPIIRVGLPTHLTAIFFKPVVRLTVNGQPQNLAHAHTCQFFSATYLFCNHSYHFYRLAFRIGRYHLP
jgi:hypothetical protein